MIISFIFFAIVAVAPIIVLAPMSFLSLMVVFKVLGDEETLSKREWFDTFLLIFILAILCGVAVWWLIGGCSYTFNNIPTI